MNEFRDIDDNDLPVLYSCLCSRIDNLREHFIELGKKYENSSGIEQEEYDFMLKVLNIEIDCLKKQAVKIFEEGSLRKIGQDWERHFIPSTSENIH